MKAMTAVQKVKDSLLQPKIKVKVVNEIKEKARPSIMSRLAEKKKELAEREVNKKNDLKKYEDQIQKAIEMMKDPGFIVEEYDQGLAVWNEDKFDIQEIRNVQEIQKGAIEFVDKFHECSEKSVYRKNQYEIFDHSFVADVMEYAFDEKKRGKIHKTLEQKIIQSAKIRKVIQKLKKLKNILKGAAL